MSVIKVYPVSKHKVVLDLDSYTYSLCRINETDKQKIYYWKCNRNCGVFLKTVVVEGQHVKLGDNSTKHDHNSDVYDLFRVVPHPSGHIYLPPDLWRY